MRNLAISIVAASTLFAAVPATAQAWRPQAPVQRQIQNDINQLERQIQRAAQRGTISQREARSLRQQALNVQRQYNQSLRGGLSRQEVAQLEVRVNDLRQRLRLERRDWDGRRG